MTPYDAAMVSVIVAGMVWGAVRGIVWQVASIASLVLGYSVSHTLSAQVAPYLPGEPVVARAVAMIVVYVVTSGGVFLAAWLIRATLRRMRFEAYDRHLGMVLGGMEGALLGLVVTLFVVSLAPGTRDPIFASPTGRVVGTVMSSLGPVLPEEARSVLAPFWAGSGAVKPEKDEEGTPPPARASRPAQATATASATAEQPVKPSASPRDASASPASFRDLLEKSEQQIGKAVIDGAADGLRNAARSESGHARDGTSERR